MSSINRSIHENVYNYIKHFYSIWGPTHSNTLAWKTPWMEEPHMLQSMGLLSHMRLRDFIFFLSIVFQL